MFYYHTEWIYTMRILTRQSLLAKRYAKFTYYFPPDNRHLMQARLIFGTNELYADENSKMTSMLTAARTKRPLVETRILYYSYRMNDSLVRTIQTFWKHRGDFWGTEKQYMLRFISGLWRRSDEWSVLQNWISAPHKLKSSTSTSIFAAEVYTTISCWTLQAGMRRVCVERCDVNQPAIFNVGLWNFSVDTANLAQSRRQRTRILDWVTTNPSWWPKKVQGQEAITSTQDLCEWWMATSGGSHRMILSNVEEGKKLAAIHPTSLWRYRWSKME